MRLLLFPAPLLLLAVAVADEPKKAVIDPLPAGH